MQAGERTSHLFRLANCHGGMVVGTGDLSELALGWCDLRRRRPHVALQRERERAEDADQVPGALGGRIRRVRRRREARAATRARDRDQPELVPGKARSSREAERRPLRAAGLQPLLHAALRLRADQGRLPGAWHALARQVRRCGEIKKWLGVFLQRFFQTSQFKRSAVPNAPKVGSGGSLSPRGDWRAPSDGNANTWLKTSRGFQRRNKSRSFQDFTIARSTTRVKLCLASTSGNAAALG